MIKSTLFMRAPNKPINLSHSARWDISLHAATRFSHAGNYPSSGR